MPISQMILPEFEHEMANTRKTLERVPDDKFDWKPHEKSMTLGALSSHVANIAGWTASTFAGDELDLQPEGAEPYREEEAKAASELLAIFDKNVASARAALEAATDENWQGKWSLKMTGKTFFTLPRTGGNTWLHPESPDSSPRSTRRLSAPSRHSGAGDLWTVSG